MRKDRCKSNIMYNSARLKDCNIIQLIVSSLSSLEQKVVVHY